LSNGEIAAQLTISTNTVRHRVRNILAKLEVTNRIEAVYVAMQRGLVE
jgi:DNA-binding NarL/FixJ family response regulator